MKEPILPFVAPTSPPQTSEDLFVEIADLLDSAPSWNKHHGDFAWELAHLSRNHVSIRSAIEFSREIANDYDKALKTSKDPTEIFRAQGAIEALTRFYSSLLTEMRLAETKETPQ